MRRIAQLLRRFIYERRRYLFYTYDKKQGEGRADPYIFVYSNWGSIPVHYRKIAVASPWTNAMYYRMKQGQARLLCYSKDGQKLDAYGWIQDWRPFRRRFGAIASQGTMLGFYWTAPEARGQGLYGRLLSHSISLCSKEQPIVICASPDNKASQRGIEKAGFKPLGEWEMRLYFRWFLRMNQSPAQNEMNPDELY